MINTITGLHWTIELALWIGVGFFIFTAIYTKLTAEDKK